MGPLCCWHPLHVPASDRMDGRLDPGAPLCRSGCTCCLRAPADTDSCVKTPRCTTPHSLLYQNKSRVWSQISLTFVSILPTPHHTKSRAESATDIHPTPHAPPLRCPTLQLSSMRGSALLPSSPPRPTSSSKTAHWHCASMAERPAAPILADGHTRPTGRQWTYPLQQTLLKSSSLPARSPNMRPKSSTSISHEHSPRANFHKTAKSASMLHPFH